MSVQGATVAPKDALEIPTAGNIFVTSGESGNPRYDEERNSAIDIEGHIRNWSDPATVLSVYFKTSASGRLNLQIHGRAGSDKSSKSTILVSVEGRWCADPDTFHP